MTTGSSSGVAIPPVLTLSLGLQLSRRRSVSQSAFAGVANRKSPAIMDKKHNAAIFLMMKGYLIDFDATSGYSLIKMMQKADFLFYKRSAAVHCTLLFALSVACGLHRSALLPASAAALQGRIEQIIETKSPLPESMAGSFKTQKAKFDLAGYSQALLGRWGGSLSFAGGGPDMNRFEPAFQHPCFVVFHFVPSEHGDVMLKPTILFFPIARSRLSDNQVVLFGNENASSPTKAGDKVAPMIPLVDCRTAGADGASGFQEVVFNTIKTLRPDVTEQDVVVGQMEGGKPVAFSENIVRFTLYQQYSDRRYVDVISVHYHKDRSLDGWVRYQGWVSKPDWQDYAIEIAKQFGYDRGGLDNAWKDMELHFGL